MNLTKFIFRAIAKPSDVKLIHFGARDAVDASGALD